MTLLSGSRIKLTLNPLLPCSHVSNRRSAQATQANPNLLKLLTPTRTVPVQASATGSPAPQEEKSAAPAISQLGLASVERNAYRVPEAQSLTTLAVTDPPYKHICLQPPTRGPSCFAALFNSTFLKSHYQSRPPIRS
ncbi:hypothetical protein PTTG_25345 [Puccinia triticina 1-1 BBBD Race 1]|uniref:Uncharacterized protein n=1 Tax=Puccinia triticina (isolate 1-1 / race 1 (BBBD)) TaxID=630390 RepID=A0A180H2T4_PUCT1|nr:hypothetical protein PTTG_25345 [Puccinia triticina 1-1 BBBD Race 1]